MRSHDIAETCASQNVRDGDVQAEVPVPRPVVLDVAHPLVEGEQLGHAFRCQHVVLVNHDNKVSAAYVGEVVTAPLLVLFMRVNKFGAALKSLILSGCSPNTQIECRLVKGCELYWFGSGPKVTVLPPTWT